MMNVTEAIKFLQTLKDEGKGKLQITFWNPVWGIYDQLDARNIEVVENSNGVTVLCLNGKSVL